MTTISTTPTAPIAGRLSVEQCQVDDLAALVGQTTDLADFPHADAVAEGVLLYDAAGLRRTTTTEAGRTAVEAELARALTDGPGIVVLQGAFPDHDVVDRVTAGFDEIIAEEERSGAAAGDHFAAPGSNSRVWNALEKLALRDPEAFVDYYANDVLALICTAWLGPAYQVTSQVNVVRPGGQAQDPHRDYHLGFLTDAVAARYPTHVHLLSPALTLQGAVAHTDMPVESGPTMYLPYSHQYVPGYLAWRRPDFRDFFAEHYVQLPLAKGDAAFFNPALFHGAGTNVSADIQRCANLLQVSSAFGRAMEVVDRAAVVSAVYPALRARRTAWAGTGSMTHAVAASAEGYPFPTNLDRDQPVDSLTPPSQADLVTRALAEDWTPEQVDEALGAYTGRRLTRDA